MVDRDEGRDREWECREETGLAGFWGVMIMKRYVQVFMRGNRCGVQNIRSDRLLFRLASPIDP